MNKADDASDEILTYRNRRNRLSVKQLKMIGLNQNAIEYMQMLGFRDAVLIAERFTT